MSFKTKSSGSIKPPKQKFMAIIAKNAKLKDVTVKFLHNLCQKWQKTYYFQKFHFS